MPNPAIRYQLDPSGTNQNNLVVGETHALSQAQIRAVAPTYGPFFTVGLKVYDNGNNALLVRGVDYQVVEILQEACLKFGKEIAQLILILNNNVSGTVRLDYQVLGGLYQNNSAGVVSMYESFMQDDRPVDWINVLNKPIEYTPTLHNHFLEDVYGFEPVIVALERIRNAIVLSDVPAFEALVEWVNDRLTHLPSVSTAEIDSISPVEKYVTFDKLLYALDKLNFNGIILNPPILQMRDGEMKQFSITTTNVPDESVLYWAIENDGTLNNDFSATSGILNVRANRAVFNITLAPRTVQAESNEAFRILIRRGSANGPIMMRSHRIIVSDHNEAIASTADLNTYLNACCLFDPVISVNPVSMYILAGR